MGKRIVDEPGGPSREGHDRHHLIHAWRGRREAAAPDPKMARLLLLRGQGFARRRPLHRRLAMTRPRYGPTAGAWGPAFSTLPPSRPEGPPCSTSDASPSSVAPRS